MEYERHFQTLQRKSFEASLFDKDYMVKEVTEGSVPTSGESAVFHTVGDNNNDDIIESN